MALKIEYVPVGDLREYERNARTHDVDQVAQIAASITEFGFTNPVLIDENNELIAGHGRTQAAISIGLQEVPAIRWADVSKSMRRNGAKDVICGDCGTEFTVRKDTRPEVCRRCAGSRGGRSHASKPISERWREGVSHCAHCKKPIRKSLGHTYCSVGCRKESSRISRTCKQCKTEFKVYRSALSGKTNASGNFCKRPCYEQWLCQTDRVKGRGSRWRSIRNDAVRRQPFCAMCGRAKRLQVHHIVPYRLTRDNRQVNLVPLCAKHHKFVESITNNLEGSGVDPGTLLLFMRLAMNEAAQVTFTGAKEASSREV